MSQMLPPQLLAALQGETQGAETDQLQVLQEIMQDLPKLIASLTDSVDTENAIQCLKILAGIQSKLMGGRGGPAQPQR